MPENTALPDTRAPVAFVCESDNGVYLDGRLYVLHVGMRFNPRYDSVLVGRLRGAGAYIKDVYAECRCPKCGTTHAENL